MAGIIRRVNRHPAFLAAATRLHLDAAKPHGWTQKWQDDAWRYFDTLGEVKFATYYLANAAAMLDLYAVERDDDGEWVTSTNADAIAAVERLAGASGDHSDLLREAAVNLTIPGEALALDTLVATPDGFTTMGELKQGDIVLSGDGEPCTVLVAHPIRHDRECYEVRLTGDVRIVADADHLWVTRSALDRVNQTGREKARISAPTKLNRCDVESRIVTTAEMRETLKYGNRSNHVIDVTVVRGSAPESGAELDPYVLGFWLGDGTTTQGAITLHADDQPHVRERFESAGYRWSPRPGDARGFSIGIRGLQADLRALGVLGNKHIPRAYLRHTEEARWALLQGLIDSDGHVDKRAGDVEFSNTNQQLLWDVVELAASLGLKPSRPSLNRIRFVSGGNPVASLPRKVERITGPRVEDRRRYVRAVEPVKSRPVRCITVDSPDGTFLVTERMVRTHNCYLVGTTDPEGPRMMGADPLTVAESWEIRSTDEVRVKNNAYEVRDEPDGKWRAVTKDEAFIARIWQRHPRYSYLADSMLHGVLSTCEEITRIERFIRATAINRIAQGAGMLLIPDELRLGKDNQSDDGDPDAPEADSLLDTILQTMITAVRDEGSAAAVVPVMLSGPGEYLDKVRWVEMSPKIEPRLLELDRAVQRLAQGLNVPPEIITGKADANHWTGWLISEDMFTAHVAPLARMLVWALTTVYLRPALDPSEANRYAIAYDPTRLIQRPTRGSDADFGLTAGAISAEAWRREKGFEDSDAPDGEAAPDAPPTPADGPPPEPDDVTEPIEEPEPSAVVGAARSRNVGEDLVALDKAWRTRLSGLVDATMTRSLERAGARLRSKLRNDAALGPIAASAANPALAATLGPRAVTAAGVTDDDLLRDSFAPLAAPYLLGTAATQRRAWELLGIDPTDVEVAKAADDQSSSLAWLTAALLAVAADRLYSPAPIVPELGEISDAVVPLTILRESMARAGGATPEGIAGRILVDASTRPAGGIATGEATMSSLRDRGGSVGQYEWVYGPASRTRPFAPHEALDGLEFDDWNDPALTVDGGFPESSFYYPGDHDGCVCDFVPLVGLPEEG